MKNKTNNNEKHCGMIIVVVTNKGGVGKTCIAINLGTALARLGKRVLVIDDDPQSNTSATLLPPTESNRKNTLYELMHPDTKQIDVSHCIYPSPHQKNLFVLPNVKASSVLEMMMVPNFPDSLFILKRAVKTYAETNFDYTIIDTPPNIGMITSNALCTAHFALVPVDVSAADSLDGFQGALDLIEVTKKSNNPELKFLKLLVNKMHKRKDICHALEEDIRRDFDNDLIFRTSIPDNTHIQKAVYTRQTIYNFDKSSTGARAFTLLGREIIGLLETN